MRLSDTGSKALDMAKVLLLMGVVLIHCNVVTHHEVGSAMAAGIISYVSSTFCGTLCVPSFFIISGYLFFLNTEGDKVKLFAGKLRKRVNTLLIPYILWCTIYGLVRIVKANYLGFDGDGIVVDGEVSVTGFLRGYWDTGDGFPMGFALWYVRNLIVFSILSPLVYIVGRRWYLSVAMILLCLIFETTLYGLLYFTIGAMLSLHGIDVGKSLFRGSGIVAFLLYSVGMWWIAGSDIGTYSLVIMLVPVGFYSILRIVIDLETRWRNRADAVLSVCKPSYFFVYCMHGMYSTVLISIFAKLFGLQSFIGAMGCYVMSFVTNVTLSYLFYLIVKAVSPKVLGILTGQRTA